MSLSLVSISRVSLFCSFSLYVLQSSSDQIPTFLKISVHRDIDSGKYAAYGLLVQTLPPPGMSSVGLTQDAASTNENDNGDRSVEEQDVRAWAKDLIDKEGQGLAELDLVSAKNMFGASATEGGPAMEFTEGGSMHQVMSTEGLVAYLQVENSMFTSYIALA
jgi:hypothetical protein